MRVSIDQRAWISGLLAFFATIGTLRLGTFHPIGSGLDPSWVAALGDAATRGDLFGRDLIFTGGPFTSLYTRYFDAVQWIWVLPAGLLVAASLAWSCARLASTWGVAFLLPAAILVGIPDALLIAVPAIAALAVLVQPRAPFSLVLLTAAAAGALSLAKFSVFPVAVVAFVAVDLEFLAERRLPVGVAAFAAAVIGWFALLEGNLTYFFDFLRYSAETSTGYSAAMSIEGSNLELIAFLVLAAGLAGAIFQWGYRRSRTGLVLNAVLAIVILSIFGFTGFKLGFVRHDRHSFDAWGTLALAAAAYAGLEGRPAMRRFGIALSLTGAVVLLALIYVFFGVNPPTEIRNRVVRVRDNLSSLGELALAPGNWLQAQRSAMEVGRAAVRAATPLPDLHGSVDVLPSIQSAVIAAGLDYRPRFSIQDYTTYTAALIEKNRASWFGPRAPDHILFGLRSIDGRLPALEEGPLWPDLLRFYEPTQHLKDLVVLGRRADPLPELLGPPKTRTARIGQRFKLGPEATFLVLDIRPTWLGRLLSFALKPPVVSLRLRYGGGREAVYRIIPEIARAGFVVSPDVRNADDFLALAMGDTSFFSPKRRPVAAWIEVGKVGAWAYHSEIRLKTRTIDTATLERSRIASPTTKDLKVALAGPVGLNRLLDAVTFSPPFLTPIPEGLLVHAPRRIVVTADKGQAVTVTFGLRDGAWQGGETDGACFRASSEAGGVLWERCLDPRRQPADRGVQRATFPLPAAHPKIVLETLCGPSCDWDWTYWASFETSP